MKEWTEETNKSILARQKEECKYDCCTTFRGCTCTPYHGNDVNISHIMDSIGQRT